MVAASYGPSLITLSERLLVRASPDAVRALLVDYGRRARVLPDGWRLAQVLEDHGGPGSRMEVEAKIGPAPLSYVFELQEVGEGYLLEGQIGSDNLLTRWTLTPQDQGCLVQLEMQVEYGGVVGEFFVRRRVSRALRQMLARLKETLEAGREAAGQA